ncbi:hypothetical protein PWA69_001441 [Campylobacter coli]|nr:hypothetical protein [Campylobacter coli]
MKAQINNLKDYAELAQASYFNFEFMGNRKIYELDSQGNKIKDESYPRGYKEIEITLEHIVSQKYYNQEVLVNLQQGDDIFTEMRNDANEAFNRDKLNGEFGEIQAKNVAKRYEIKFHQPNTASGFSATLFYDTHKDRFIVGFRGTESNIKNPLEALKDLATDIGLTFGKGDFQVNALKQFLLDIAPILNKVDSNKIIFVGHSLGGYLAVIAMQFCDTIDRSLNTQFNTIKFMASQVYTFNSPAIDGIDNMLMRALAALLDKNIMEQVLNPQKVYCVYDSGGVNIIASAQYGSRNRLPIYTGKDSHSIIPLTQTLYFYSYLLELESNDTTIHRSIAHRKAKKTSANNATTNNTNTQNTHTDSTISHKDTNNTDSTTNTNTNTPTQTHNTLADYLHELNVFMDNVRIAMNILVYEIDRENQKKYERFKKEQAWYEKTPKHNDIDFLALLISQINEIAYKLEALKEDSNTYFTPSIDKENIIEALLQFIESNYFIQIFDNELLRKMRNQCKANAKVSIQEKLSLATCQPFSVVSGNETSYINDSNYHEIYGYKGLGDLLSQEWHEEFTNGKYKIAKGLYFNGNTYSSFTKYMIHNAKEKEVIC